MEIAKEMTFVYLDWRFESVQHLLRFSVTLLCYVKAGTDYETCSAA